MGQVEPKIGNRALADMLRRYDEVVRWDIYRQVDINHGRLILIIGGISQIALVVLPVILAFHGIKSIGLYNFAAIVLMAASYWSSKLARPYYTKSDLEIRQTDPRAPVLYLRNFSSDDEEFPVYPDRTSFLYPQKWHIEHALCSGFDSVGSMIAVGRPQDDIPHVGVTRLYITNPYWQVIINELMELSQFIVVRYDNTQGLNWEIGNITARGFWGKSAILVVDKNGSPYSEIEYAYVAGILRDEYKLELPSYELNMYYVWSDNLGNWHPICSDNHLASFHTLLQTTRILIGKNPLMRSALRENEYFERPFFSEFNILRTAPWIILVITLIYFMK